MEFFLAVSDPKSHKNKRSVEYRSIIHPFMPLSFSMLIRGFVVMEGLAVSPSMEAANVQR
jgi:hypothetical protein